MSYTKLANSILTSTIWMEDDHTRLVWLAMIAMVNRHGEVMASIPGLANVARVPVESCRAAIQKFLSPDPDSRTKTDEGRRIREIPGGWFLINHDYYRFLASDEDRRNKAAIRQQRVRDRKKDVESHAESHAKRDAGCDGRDKSPQFSHADADAEAEEQEQEQEEEKRAEAEAAPPTPEAPPEEAVPDLKNHPTIVAIREACGIYPPKLIWQELIDHLGANIDLVKLKQCLVKWVAKGYNKTNYAWATDWYLNGIPTQQKNGKSTTQSRNKNVEALDEWRELAEKLR